MLDEIERAAKGAQEAALYVGTVVKDATQEEDGIMVRVHGFQGTRGRDAFGPLPWHPRYDVGAPNVTIRYPVKGDRCWVAFDDSGEGIVLTYADPDWF